MSTNMLIRLSLLVLLMPLVNTCLADTITISCVRDSNSLAVSTRVNVRFIFDTSSTIGEVHFKEIHQALWKKYSADVSRSEKEVILLSKSKYPKKYWISRTTLSVRESNPRVIFTNCKMKREKAPNLLF